MAQMLQTRPHCPGNFLGVLGFDPMRRGLGSAAQQPASQYKGRIPFSVGCDGAKRGPPDPSCLLPANLNRAFSFGACKSLCMKRFERYRDETTLLESASHLFGGPIT